MGVHHVSDKADFSSQLASAGSKLVVVDFFATWCGPCKMISPALDKMSEELVADVVFLKVDVDENEDIATDHKVTVMPTFLLFRNGQKVDEFSGANESKLRELITKNNCGDSNGCIELTKNEKTGIATICISNYKKRNALNDKLVEQLSQAITQLEEWPTVKTSAYCVT
ncbi:unnamed protein product [Oppiella nova]|uniref:Thioredoxin domain-containing protein n=1 Tax=Oppiella nova TaxID=334625 RepID=A0A7R9QTQ6_9ACAR|nr:unnamed protein product [Oppiella nova]CAG2175181.1 unnamed protein product [Oppiella nova]